MTVDQESVEIGGLATVRIRALASSGAGLGELPDGRVVFVQRTAPGDVADVRIAKLHKRWGEGDLEVLRETGPGRVTPGCPNYDVCGGCTLLHVSYEEQLKWKRRFVSDALERIGDRPADVPEVVPSPSRTQYRNRVTFTLRRLSGGRLVAGFHALRDPDRVVAVGKECLLPEPIILEVWEALRAAWAAGIRPLPATKELRITLRAVGSGVVVVIRGGQPSWDPSLLLAHVPGIASVWHQPGGHLRARHLAGESIHEEWGDERLPLGGLAFLQVNRAAAEGLVEYVLGQAGSGTKAVDAYCGVGVYGRSLARQGWQVTGIERDPEACVAARHDAPGGFEVMEGPVEDLLAQALPADLVVLNPPRTGLQEWIPGMLAFNPPSRVVYVSCNPATLARDASRLGTGFSLESVRSFDLFPQTSHVETVAVFKLTRDT